MATGFSGRRKTGGSAHVPTYLLLRRYGGVLPDASTVLKTAGGSASCGQSRRNERGRTEVLDANGHRNA